MQNFSQIKQKLSEMLSKERYQHSLNVAKEAAKLAQKWEISTENAELAALLHDISRFLTPEQMLKKAQELGIECDEIECLQPKLLHARLSAYYAKKDFKVTNKEILKAIELHTLGAPNMSKLEKIIYLADHIEPSRDYEDVDEVRKLAYNNMDKAIAKSTCLMIESLTKKGLPVDAKGLKTRDFYLKCE